MILHYALAARSLLVENATVDEVVHLPAGITYWQKGTFRLYHHNPPLFKLAAALPVLMMGPMTEPLYLHTSWTGKDPSQTTFSQFFAILNAGRYLEMLQLARLTMPIFTMLGGLVVFAWSARLYGSLAGLLSLALWVFCPNILAHGRLITSDASSTVMGVAATYAFWRYLSGPSWRRAVVAGIVLGIAQLSKFSMILLYGAWPLLWLMRLALTGRPESTVRFAARSLAHGIAIVALSILTIDVGYGFEGVGTRLGDYEFGSRTFTRPVPPGTSRPHSRNELFEASWQFRVNRFRGTWLERLPVPLPRHYLEGFDEQKIETEGIPSRYFAAVEIQDPRQKAAVIEQLRRTPESDREDRQAYLVYLDGELRRTGWKSYYLMTLLYKMPEGTWLLLAISLVPLALSRRTRIGWFDELSLLIVPALILLSMTLLTDINLGLRYVLGILPYVFIAIGKVVPWCLAMREPWRRVAGGLVAGSLALTVAASMWIHPHYLAYFNWASGGPDREPPHLIDSNLDWGQDLVEFQRWWKKTIPDQPIGLAYFGQINPSLFAMRGEPFRWFLPPGLPGTVHPMFPPPSPRLIGPARRLTPGYYAVSASLLYGLRWGLYDPAPPMTVPEAAQPQWNYHPGPGGVHALGYFRRFRPIMPPIGHSIYVYHLTEEDVAAVNAELERALPRR
ncbi:MAG: ArnT family glycosyltransferase [Isosphaeraceae bacterium]